MASTLSIHSSTTSSSFNSFVPPPSQDFAMQQMPNVFVIPPEEELETNPPWCYFDATQSARDSLSTLPDMDTVDVALRLCQQRDNRAPTFHRTFTNESQETIVMPRRGRIMKLHDMDLEMEDGQTDIRSRGAVRRFDDEIVEVVKVRRNEGMVDVGEVRQMKKSNTFRARATQALRSIKLNVGKGQRQRSVSASGRRPTSESQTGATLPERHSFQDPHAIPKPASSPISRRRSLTLSQFFTLKENQPSRPASPSDEPMITSSPTLVQFERISISSPRPLSPTDSAPSQSQPRHLHPSPSLESNEDNTSKPTLSKRKSFRRRLSVLELQKLFTIGGSGSSQTETASQQEMRHDAVSPSEYRSRSMDIASLFTASSSRTTVISSSASTVFGDVSPRLSSSTQLINTNDEDSVEAELEMRLDSLHFDSLHFDPDEILSSL